MKGINYVTDDGNNKIAVIIDLEIYGGLWEEFYDKLLIEQRKNEKSDSMESFIDGLKKEGLWHG